MLVNAAQMTLAYVLCGSPLLRDLPSDRRKTGQKIQGKSGLPNLFRKRDTARQASA